MGPEGVFRVQIVQVVFRIVLDHADFLQHDLFLFGHLPGIKAGVVEDVRQQLDPLADMLVQNLRVERGPLPRGEGVELAAERVDLARNGLGRAAARALENHMLDKVREAFLTGLLVPRADIHPNADRDRPHRGYPLGDDPNAVVQHFLAEHRGCRSFRIAPTLSGPASPLSG